MSAKINLVRNLSCVCTISSCRNRHGHARADPSLEHIRYHSFPKDVYFRGLWVDRCAQPGDWNPDVRKVCSIHFQDDDYERDLKSELLNLPRKWVLKRDAVPTLHLDDCEANNVSGDLTIPPEAGDPSQQKSQEQAQPLVGRQPLEPVDFLSLTVKEEQPEDCDGEQTTPRAPPCVWQLCRVCAGASERMVPIFQEEGQIQHLANKMEKYLPITVEEGDRLPVRVCGTCVSALEACHELAQRCTQADVTLRRLLQEEDRAGLVWDTAENITSSTDHLQEPRQRWSSIRDRGSKQDSEPEPEVVWEVMPKQEESARDHAPCKPSLQANDSAPPSPSLAENTPLSQRLAIIRQKQQQNSTESKTENADTLKVRSLRCASEKSKAGRFSCWECGATLEDLGTFMQHQKEVHARELRPCHVCGSIFETERQFNKHWREVHPRLSKIDLNTNFAEVPRTRQLPARNKRRSPSPKPVPINSRRTLRTPKKPIQKRVPNSRSKSVKKKSPPEKLSPPKPIKKLSVVTRMVAKPVRKESESSTSSCEDNIDLDEPYIPDEKPEPKSSAYSCKMCSKGYESKSGRRNHYVAAHKRHECKVCEELFPTPQEAEQHEKQPHKIACSQCPEYFQSQSSLKMHVSSKHLEGPKQYKCSQCGRDYVSKSALMTHEKLHKIKEPSICDVCNKSCKTPTALKYHKFVHMTDEEKTKVGFACTMCDKKFPGKTRLTLHMRRHTDERPCECPTCHKTFHDSERLKAHMEGHSTEKRFKCDQCEACFVSKRYLVNHMYLSHRRRQVIRCIVCKIVFPSMKEVINHQRTHTPEEIALNNGGNEPYTKSIEFHCKECNEYFSRKDLLRLHKARFHAKERIPNKSNVPIKQLECKLCGKKVWGTAGLGRHMRVHTGQAPARTFQCEFCAKLFAQKMQMVLHIRTHTGEKPFRCQFCDKGFINVNSLVVHERIHTGENPFQCDKCPKAFRSNSNLVAHLQTHSDVKPYECHYCHKRFGRLIHLKLHLRTHTGERPYVCDICGRAFTQGGDMRKHRLTHTGERAYKCELCDFSSNKRKTLTEHQAAAHPSTRGLVTSGLPPLNPEMLPNQVPHNVHIQSLQGTTEYPQPSSSYLKIYENWSEN